MAPEKQIDELMNRQMGEIKRKYVPFTVLRVTIITIIHIYREYYVSGHYI